MYLSGNLVNSLSDYLDTSKEFIKAYPIDKIADVQTGYILKRNQGYTDISKYYLFKDGTGFELEVSVDQLEKVKDPKDYSSFVKTYAKEVTFIEKVLNLSLLMRNLDRETSFQLQVAPSNTFVEKCKSLRQKHFGSSSQA